MTEDDARPARRKWWKYLLALFLLGLIAAAGVAWYMTTDSFHAYVRARIVAEMEKITGGRVELGGDQRKSVAPLYSIVERLPPQVGYGLSQPGIICGSGALAFVRRIDVVD